MLMSEETNILHFMKYPGVYFVKGKELITDILKSVSDIQFSPEPKPILSPERIIDDIMEYAYLDTPITNRELSIIEHNAIVPTRYEFYDDYTQEEIDLYRTIGCGIVHASNGRGIVSLILIDESVDLYERTMGLVSKYESDVMSISINHITHIQTKDLKRVLSEFKKYIPSKGARDVCPYYEEEYRRRLEKLESSKISYLRISETANLLGNSFKCSSTSLHLSSISNRCIEPVRIRA